MNKLLIHLDYLVWSLGVSLVFTVIHSIVCLISGRPVHFLSYFLGGALGIFVLFELIVLVSAIIGTIKEMRK